MIILNESKRDDFLMPYVEMLNSKGVKCTHGELKKWLLRHLTANGGLNNLSLGSNFYFAGAVRYYFNGDLTENKDLSIFNDGKTEDIWKNDVCRRLNALILILRNSVVDSLGETFEQPEDFGDLPLPKLLRKYGAKINKELGIDTPKKEKAKKEDEVDTLDRTPNVGKGYTFEILYSYNDATKYYQYTKPGAWCITYGEGHYNGYIRRLGIHYVIFKQDGFENVPRKMGDGGNWTKSDSYREWYSPKPQDEYGCSLIALLQSNTNGEPVYITSRWNHGASESSNSCEADHAFTKEEFMEKTGVTDADLQRIFEIWKKDYKTMKPKSSRGGGASPEERAAAVRSLRDLKYRQMRIFGGENPDTALVDKDRDESNENYIAKIQQSKTVLVGNGKPFKSVTVYRTVLEGNVYYVLVDRGTILFETLTPESEYVKSAYYRSTFTYTQSEDRSDFRWIKNAIVCRIKGDRYMIYSLQLRRFVDIGGVTKFKYLDNTRTYQVSNPIFYEIKLSNNQCALVDINTNKPLRLPNGEYWSESITWKNKSSYYSRQVRPNLVGGDVSYLIFKYDSAADISFVYDVNKRAFIDIDSISIGGNSHLMVYKAPLNGYDDITVVENDSFAYSSRGGYLMRNNKKLSIGPITIFERIRFVEDLNAVEFCLPGSRNTKWVIWSENHKSFILDENDNIKLFPEAYHMMSDDKKVIYFKEKLDSTDVEYYHPHRYIYSVSLLPSFITLINPSNDTEKFVYGRFNRPNNSDKLIYDMQITSTDAYDKENVETKTYTIEELIRNGYFRQSIKSGSALIRYADENNESGNDESENISSEPMAATVNEEVNEYTIDDIKNMVTETINKLLIK